MAGQIVPTEIVFNYDANRIINGKTSQERAQALTELIEQITDILREHATAINENA